jgi:sugar phosphate isomerase/epimerase
MQFAICNETFQNWKLEDTMRFVAETGYNGIEIAPFTLARYVTDISAAARQEIRGLAERAGIAITGIHWVLAQTEGLHLTHPDPAVREHTSRYLVELVDFCRDIGGNIIVLGSPKQRQVSPDVTMEQALGWAKETLFPSVMQAMNRGVTICLEPLAPAETNFINTAEEAIRFTAQYRTPSFKVILDVKAMSSEAKPIPEIIQSSWPNFAYFHANDKNLKGPGFGDVDFVPIFSALKGVGYQGWVSVEVFTYDEGPEVIARESLAYMKKAYAVARPAPRLNR